MARNRSYRGADRPFCVMRTPLLCGKKPLRQPNRDMGTWMIAVLFCSQQKGSQPCLDSQKNALCDISNYAAFVRRLADRTQVETARGRLHTLADQFDQLAESVHGARLAA